MRYYQIVAMPNWDLNLIVFAWMALMHILLPVHMMVGWHTCQRTLVKLAFSDPSEMWKSNKWLTFACSCSYLTSLLINYWHHDTYSTISKYFRFSNRLLTVESLLTLLKCDAEFKLCVLFGPCCLFTSWSMLIVSRVRLTVFQTFTAEALLMNVLQTNVA